MQNIGLDMGYIKSKSNFGRFIIEMVRELIVLDPSISYTLYTNEPIALKGGQFTSIQTDSRASIKTDLAFNKTLKSKVHNLMIFFDSERMIFYKKRHYCFLESLQEISYPSKVPKSHISNMLKSYFLRKFIHSPQKLLCFDNRSKEELNESFDRKEDNIIIVPGFFCQSDLKKVSREEIQSYPHTDDYNYLIYEGGTGANKNLEKLIKAMSLLSEEGSKIRLYIIGDELLRDLQLREYIVHYKAAGLIDVMGDIHYKKKAYFYHHAKGIILPSLYESFPFSLGNAVGMNKNILGSNIPAIKNVFGDKIRYFNPLSVNQIRQQLLELQNSSNEIDYRDITEKYTPEISAKVLLHEINN